LPIRPPASGAAQVKAPPQRPMEPVDLWAAAPPSRRPAAEDAAGAPELRATIDDLTQTMHGLTRALHQESDMAAEAEQRHQACAEHLQQQVASAEATVAAQRRELDDLLVRLSAAEAKAVHAATALDNAVRSG